jgi:hypothetical protein
MIHLLYVENHAVFAETVKQKFLSEYSVTIVPSLYSAREKVGENSGGKGGEEWPQIRLALSRGFAVSGLLLGGATQGGALEDSHLPWAIIFRPYQGFQFAASPITAQQP